MFIEVVLMMLGKAVVIRRLGVLKGQRTSLGGDSGIKDDSKKE